MRLHLAIAALLGASSCLAAPDPSGDPSNTPNSTSNSPNNSNNDTPDAGDDDGTASAEDMPANPGDMADDDPDVACANCTAGVTRCSPNDATLWQECVNIDGCHVWATTETCSEAQTCNDAEGCSCPDTCDPNESPDCPAMGVTACLIIDGCPQLVDVGRDSSCAPPGAPAGAPSCDDAPEMSYCRECTADRGCEDHCGNERGWSCGSR